MKKLRTAALSAVLAFASSAAFAEVKTVTLSVPGMYCSTCPITVKTAISRVPGVSRVSTSLEKKQAVVTYDDAKASVESLTEATANAGYPSTLAQ
ncbi:MAG TPA: mercury resistance system periplasmic binding protein MerP [Burkholderiales bacterium]|nr:mercury resistance system periplasmic binding protein MerP [Burkholderiales bacterium]